MEATKRCCMQRITVLSLILFTGIIPLAEAQGDCSLALVPRSGQTTSYDFRDDGYLQLGLDWLGPRFTDNSDGTATDNLTGLIWLKNAGCTTFFSGDSTGQNARFWLNALTAANSLGHGYCGLTDNSSAGEWRLPNVRELASLIDYGQNPALPSDHPFDSVHERYYWSSTTFAEGTDKAWIVSLALYPGLINYSAKTGSPWFVLPVKGGQ